ncbi:polysaccharide deacetylase family protein [Elizabethkingia meningoseptica]|uniref:polysaccharide deacetylase family protein n=1 Tax=Elizabethkingia meningoseptica TaxID=238 RepID=UPI00162448F8|nr:polysaccharide deacetylase family protein [Elizabethkingia meningoseptica]MBG0514104.1 polysaccharide deacetylase family protein [Elizabethkingia meningoseptica]MDE5433020.1 polysaccharide deacetylase family protein [Elizabethkingia meningoseptica]
MSSENNLLPFVKPIPVNKIPINNNPSAASTLLFADEQLNPRRVSIQYFNEKIASGVTGTINTQQTLTQLNALPDGIYRASTFGTYANGLTVAKGVLTLFKKVGTVWTVDTEVLMPKSEGEIKTWGTSDVGLSYPSVRTYNSAIYRVKEGMTSGTNNPMVDNTNWEVISGKPMDYDAIGGVTSYDKFYKNSITATYTKEEKVISWIAGSWYNQSTKSYENNSALSRSGIVQIDPNTTNSVYITAEITDKCGLVGFDVSGNPILLVNSSTIGLGFPKDFPIEIPRGVISVELTTLNSAYIKGLSVEKINNPKLISHQDLTNSIEDVAKKIKSQTFISGTDRWRSKRHTAGAISFIDDDGGKNMYTHLYPLMKSKGMKLGCGIIGMWIDNKQTDVINLDQLQQLNLDPDNVELMNHTYRHFERFDQLTYQQQLKQIYDGHSWLNSKGIDPVSFVLPFGYYNDDTIKAVSQVYSNLYITTGAHNTPSNMRNREIKRLPLGPNLTDASAFFPAIDECVENNTWLVFMMHMIQEQDISRTMTQMGILFDYINSKGVPCVLPKDGFSMNANINEVYKDKVMNINFETRSY